MAYTQENRLIAIDTPLGKDELLLASLKGIEGICQLFRFELKLLSENQNIVFEDIVGKNVTILVTLADGSQRPINGLISRFSQERGFESDGSDSNLAYYRATVVPWLWLLTRNKNSRIFQNLSVPEIAKKIFEDKGLGDLKLQLHGDYKPREYCVQYGETDYNFVSRILEDEGIFYFFEHEKEKHTLVLADTPEAHLPCPNQETAVYQLATGGWFDEDTITDIEKRQIITSGKYSQTDYNFKSPNTDLNVEVASQQALGPTDLEIYHFPGVYEKRADGEDRTNLRMQEVETGITTIRGSSVCRAFTSGYRFDLKGHYRDELTNKPFVLTTLKHEATTEGSYLTAAKQESEEEFSYTNRFIGIPHSIPFRPRRTTPRPRMRGTQTAIVTGPSGEEIHTDEHGRVKVQFHWDREGQRDDKSSCWIRVNQAWAGGGWGAMQIPRIGQEVIVDFLEGDPDKPIIVGRVYHGTNKPPYDLPGEKTKSTIKSDSSIGGEGFNEIRFDDKKDEEQLFIRAERNHDVYVKNDSFLLVENSQHANIKNVKSQHVENNCHEKVDNDVFIEVGNDRNLKITGKQAVEITGSHSLKVNGNVIEKFQSDHCEETGSNYYLRAMGVVIESMSSLTLKVGGSNIVIDPSGVTLKGPMVTIDGGLVKIASGPGSSPGSGNMRSVVAPAAPLVYTAALAQVASGENVQSAGEQEQPYRRDEASTSWIEIELVDEEDNPVPGERYQITLPDGSVARGTLDENGFARIGGIEPGTCQVTFPDFDQDAWEEA
jgi:type VI secretion system secreted protein VgrG